MPMGKGTYGSKRGRPAKKKAAKKGMADVRKSNGTKARGVKKGIARGKGKRRP